MLKKILANYLSMLIIYYKQDIIKHSKHIHASKDNNN